MDPRPFRPKPIAGGIFLAYRGGLTITMRMECSWGIGRQQRGAFSICKGIGRSGWGRSQSPTDLKAFVGQAPVIDGPASGNGGGSSPLPGIRLPGYGQPDRPNMFRNRHVEPAGEATFPPSNASANLAPPPITDANFTTAINLWFSDEANVATYGHIRDWKDGVTDMSNAFKDRTTFNEDISMGREQRDGHVFYVSERNVV